MGLFKWLFSGDSSSLSSSGSVNPATGTSELGGSGIDVGGSPMEFDIHHASPPIDSTSIFEDFDTNSSFDDTDFNCANDDW